MPAWKDFRVENLQGDEIPSKDANASKQYKHPMKEQFLRLEIKVKITNLALGTGWHLPMAAALRFELGTFLNMMSIRCIDAFPRIYGVADEALLEIDEMGPKPLTGTKPKARADAEALHTKKAP